jgi:hypothetical protein
MFNNIVPAEIKATSFTDKTALSGVDLMTSIQMLLVQSYDDQLKDTAHQIKLTTKVKKLYRERIQELSKMLSMKTTQRKGEKCVFLKPDILHQHEQNFDYKADVASGTIKSYMKSYQPKGVAGKKKDEQENITGYWVRTAALESHVEEYKQKLDSLNEQTELMSIGLQSLTNQRKVCFETITNMVKKGHDCLSSIVRNV